VTLPASRPTENVAWRQRYNRKEEALFPAFWSYRHQAKQGPFSRRSRHHLRWCLPYRSRASLSLAALTAHPTTATTVRITIHPRCPLLSIQVTTGASIALYPSSHYSMEKVSRLRRLNRPRRRLRRRTASEANRPRRCRVVSVCDPRGLRPLVYAPADAGPTRSRCHRALHASCLKPGSAPSARWLAKSTAPRRAASARIAPSLRFRHDPC